MPTLHDLMAQSIDERSGALRARRPSPADATRSRIARTRRRRTAMAGGTSALAVGGLVTAGAMQDRMGDGQATPAASTAAFGMESVVIALDNGEFAAPLGWTTRLGCGSVVTGSSPSQSDFTLTTTAPASLSLATDAPRVDMTASVTYSGADRPAAFINAGQFLITDGRVVVGHLDSSGYSDDAPYELLTDGASWTEAATTQFGVDKGFQPCDLSSATKDPTAPGFAAGEYQLYVVAGVHVKEEEAALMSLYERGIEVPIGLDGDFVPGSEDCERATADARLRRSDVRLAMCDPEAAPDVVIDRVSDLAVSGVATVPYPTSAFAGSLDVTLVSGPIPVTVPRDLTWDELGLEWLVDLGPDCIASENGVCTLVAPAPNEG